MANSKKNKGTEHKNIKDNKKKPTHICPTCEKEFSDPSNLNRHKKSVHLKIKPFKCDQCDMSFCQGNALKTHQNEIHLKKKPFNCSNCNMAFARLDSLQNHIVTIHNKPR